MENLERIISLIEKHSGDEIPKSVVYILYQSGFDTRMALRKITHKSLRVIEEYFNDNFEDLIIELIDYKRNRPFKLKPGHSAIIEHIPQLLEEATAARNDVVLSRNSSDFSYVLQSLIQTAERNAENNVKAKRFPKEIQHFATYLYLMCGRACYETLSANLPIPQANTIG